MWINGVLVEAINAVSTSSSATDVGGTASIPSYYAESGLTLFHNYISIIDYWYITHMLSISA
ncbi:hypothetical protein [Sulfurisphaera ohwakuensis]|uniref:hypothetical protein n=1 Tax=Sulfurisphaera ohwakuensis TaxID=69656 RepID=UPI0036F31E67